MLRRRSERDSRALAWMRFLAADEFQLPLAALQARPGGVAAGVQRGRAEQLAQVIATHVAQIVDLEIAVVARQLKALQQARAWRPIGAQPDSRAVLVKIKPAIGDIGPLEDVAGDQLAAQADARCRQPLAIQGMHAGLPIERGSIGMGGQPAQAQTSAAPASAQGEVFATKRVAAVVLLRQQQAPLRALARQAVLERQGDVGDAFRAGIWRSTDAARVDQLAAAAGGEREQRLIFGEEGPLLVEAGFDGAEVDDQVIAFDLAEVRAQGQAELLASGRAPEQV